MSEIRTETPLPSVVAWAGRLVLVLALVLSVLSLGMGLHRGETPTAALIGMLASAIGLGLLRPTRRLGAAPSARERLRHDGMALGSALVLTEIPRLPSGDGGHLGPAWAALGVIGTFVAADLLHEFLAQRASGRRGRGLLVAGIAFLLFVTVAATAAFGSLPVSAPGPLRVAALLAGLLGAVGALAASSSARA